MSERMHVVSPKMSNPKLTQGSDPVNRCSEIVYIRNWIRIDSVLYRWKILAHGNDIWSCGCPRALCFDTAFQISFGHVLAVTLIFARPANLYLQYYLNPTALLALQTYTCSTTWTQQHCLGTGLAGSFSQIQDCTVLSALLCISDL